MGDDRRGRVSYVIGPDGSPLTLADLPPPRHEALGDPPQGRSRCRRARRTAEPRRRLPRYTLTVEEFLAWQRAIDRFGLPACAPRACSSTATSYAKW